MSTDDKRIREFAYLIWESEGKPEGQETRHWEMACKLAEAEALAPTKPARTAKPNSGKTAASKPTATKPKTKAATTAKVVTPPGDKPVAAKKPRAPRKPAG
ncbi:DUF2934 domain-containing protein [Pseudomonas sp. FW306-02-F02-AA]|jgi:hypothetical protein|uniref:DUF2934 domain-containing protein n=1 Tax=Pseudomonas fluorescens TaxID=294 RepID=A0A0N9X056_PSEFL|nr:MULTISPECIES: DUF2934 domain-containing protein [Pseudomonas]ALI03935.1 hypothetical protein AO353_23755 [Pseudomonas fluorescens]PMZ04863.1 DUF2934 domain-containing protein [Pseudomonas sp. FW306-02-F02-AB]PMZ12027.1 DUF2934 domain-containing protein [Pseudomonas sp. FW306-02-H06C]PMZ17788.1 DUF2934 domain-containing protein [Pseudomonas sp. FW306-02-F02-AA]PMZ23820.1 DUF2934 domain-containing protein [Pseudomonas sp. FW306-02-F08-AA]